MLQEKQDLKGEIAELEDRAKNLEKECLQLEAQECDLEEL